MTLEIRDNYSNDDVEVLERSAGRALDFSLYLVWGQAAESSLYGRAIRSMATRNNKPIALAQGILRRRYGVSKLQCGSTSGAGVAWSPGEEQAAIDCLQSLVNRSRPALTQVFSPTVLSMTGFSWENAYTFQVDLRRPLSQIHDAMTPEARRKVRRAQRKGITAEARRDESSLREAYELISDSARERGYPDLPRDYSLSLHRAFDHGGSQGCVIASSKGRAVSAATFLGTRDKVIWWKGGSTQEGYETSAGNLVQHTAIAWLKQAGVSTYDLGGTSPHKAEYAGIHQFKSSLGGILVTTAAGSAMSRLGRLATSIRSRRS